MYKKRCQINVLILIMVLIIGVLSDGESQCEQNSKLTQYTGTICQIDYQQCSNNNTLTIQLCVGYRCRLQVQGQCYYYSYQSFTNSRCMRDCCGYVSNNTQNYSQQLAQCLTKNIYSNLNDQQITPPSNKTAIILGAILGTVFFIILMTCVCCRHRIKQLVVGNNNGLQSANNINPIQAQNQISFAQIYSTDINFVLDNTSHQLHYDKQQQCTICLNQSTNCRTHCSHWFHVDCLTAWVKKSFHCPNCMTEQLNPITIFCKTCRKPYAEIKINKYTQARHVQNSLNCFKCNQCKNQKSQN